MFKIQKNVPIPTRGKHRNHDDRTEFLRTVGLHESFIMPDKHLSTAKAHGFWFKALKRLNYAITCRIVKRRGGGFVVCASGV